MPQSPVNQVDTGAPSRGSSAADERQADELLADPPRESVASAGAATQVESAELVSRMGLTQGHVAVCGLQWGDEGKGQIVDLLSPDFDYVVRYNGGANASHSVYVGDQKFALHPIPSGILCPGVTNVVANGVVVDPWQMCSEISGLRQRRRQPSAQRPRSPGATLPQGAGRPV
jgi:hypothetical protein